MRARRKLSTGLAALALLTAGLLSSSSALAVTPVKPAVGEQGTFGVTPFVATLYALVDPESQATTSCTFEYGPTEGYGSHGTCEPEALEGEGEQLVSSALSGLAAGATYHYRVVVANATGTTEGGDETFTTPSLEAPTVVSEGVSGLTSTDVSLEAQVNPNYQEATYEFEYAANEALTGAVMVPGGSLPAGAEAQPAGPVDVGGGLAPGTTYYYRVVTGNGTGVSRGPIERFTTLAEPVASTGQAAELTRTTAMLEGTVNPVGAATRYYFAYIDRASYAAAIARGAPNPYAGGGRTAEGTADAGYGTLPAGPLRGEELRAGTTYDYALVATNSVGSVIGPDGFFTTLPGTPPLSLTGSATGVSQRSATLTGSVDTRGLPTVMQFEFGPTPQLGSALPANVVSASGSVFAVSADFGSLLAAGSTYYYRVVANSADGVSYGVVESFTTGAYPAPFTTPVAPVPLSYTPIATLNAKEAAENKQRAAAKPPTRAQKLAKALKTCAKLPQRRRAGCKRRARTAYGASGRKAKRS
jgi:hypothetical protein